MAYLLDTNACIRILNNTSASLIARLRRNSPGEIHLCSVVKAELIYGAYHGTRVAENLRLLQRFFEPFRYLLGGHAHTSRSACNHYEPGHSACQIVVFKS